VQVEPHHVTEGDRPHPTHEPRGGHGDHTEGKRPPHPTPKPGSENGHGTLNGGEHGVPGAQPPKGNEHRRVHHTTESPK